MIDINIKSAFIRKRGDNYNVYIEFVDDEGKTKQKSQAKYKNKKDAEKHLIEIKHSINNNKFIISKDITFVDRCQKYIDDNKNEWSPYTIRNRETTLKNQIEPFFKDTLLSEVSIYQVQQFANYIFKKYSVESSKVRFAFVKCVLRESFRLREIKEDPSAYVKPPKKESENITDSYNKEEVLDLIQKLEGQVIEIPILLMLLLGLRKGEACGLRWSDVDFEDNLININQILVTDRGVIYFKAPKTIKSKRTLSAPDELMEKLKQEKLRQNKLKLQSKLKNEHDLVCLNAALNPWKHTFLNDCYRRFCKNYNVRRVRLHDLRHTNATLMLLSGTNMKIVSERLGHTDIMLSMNRYSHVLEEMDKKATENLSNLLFK